MSKRFPLGLFAMVAILMFFPGIALTATHQNGWQYPAVSTRQNSGWHGYRWCRENENGECVPVGWHIGIDFESFQGDPIYAIEHGEIADYSSNLGGYGSWCRGIDYDGSAILVKHVARGHDGFSRTFYVVYGHNDITPGLAVGDIVERGERIGTTHHYWGPRNLCTKDWSHLHFGLRPDEIDPIAPFRGRSSSLTDDNGWTNPMPFLDDNFPSPWNVSCDDFTDKYPNVSGRISNCKEVYYEPPDTYKVLRDTDSGDPPQELVVFKIDIQEPEETEVEESSRRGYGGGEWLPDWPIDNPPTPTYEDSPLALFKYIKVSREDKDDWEETLTLAPKKDFDVKVKFKEYNGPEFEGSVKFYASKDRHLDEDDDLYLGKDSFTLRPGKEEKEYSRGEEIPLDWGDGNFYIFCRVKWRDGEYYYPDEYAVIKIRSPELAVISLDLRNPATGQVYSPSELVFEGGEEVKIIAKVKNYGPGDLSENTLLKYYQAAAGDSRAAITDYPYLGQDGISRGDLEAGESETKGFPSYTIPTGPGNYRVIALVDPGKNIIGDNPDDNWLDVFFTVTGPAKPKPDFQFADSTPVGVNREKKTIAEELFSPGEGVFGFCEIRVTNPESVEQESWLKGYIAPEGSNEWELIQEDKLTLELLETESDFTFYFEFITPMKEGNYNIKAVMDSEGDVAEENENDNVAIATFTVKVSTPTIPETERNALIDFYNSTGGSSWKNNSNWLDEPGTECNWYGVTCDENVNVAAISLQDNNLIGTIPSSLGDFCCLISINTALNSLSGQIPTSIGKLSNLREISMSDNELNGSIPKEIGLLSDLRRLNLTRNSLSGLIPPEIQYLSEIEILALGGNNLSGNIPIWLGNLIKLKELYLWGNSLVGKIPSELGNLQELEILYLNENQLNGSVPSELGNLKNLRKLHLSRNMLTGTLPPELSNLVKLELFGVGGNEITGETPLWLERLSAIQELYLWGNNFSGKIPTSIGALQNLINLQLSDNELTGAIPPELGDLSNLQVLYLWGNPLSGSIPPELGNLSNLTHLSLCKTNLSSSIPPELGKLSNLTYLNLLKTNLSGSIPPELGDLLNLESLYLWGCKLSGEIPYQLGNLTKLTDLRLSFNQLSGPIPDEIGNLKNLTFLTLNMNKLSGEIPSTIGNLNKLETFSLRNNLLTNSIPQSFGNLTSLKRVWLNGNQLTGPIPLEFLNLVSLDNDRSDFRWNSLYAQDTILRQFINEKQIGGDWETTQTGISAHGDINADGILNLKDLVYGLKILTGMPFDCPGYETSGIEVNNDGTVGTSDDKFGFEELLFIMKSISR